MDGPWMRKQIIREVGGSSRVLPSSPRVCSVPQGAAEVCRHKAGRDPQGRSAAFTEMHGPGEKALRGPGRGSPLCSRKGCWSASPSATSAGTELFHSVPAGQRSQGTGHS